MMVPLRDQVQVLQATEVTDPYSGLTSYDWATPTVKATLPAYVGYTTTALVNDALASRTELVTELTAIIEPYPLDPVTQRIRWHGDDYTIDGKPKVRILNGTEHHLTVPLKLVEG